MLHTQHILFNQASRTPGIRAEEQKTRKQNKDLKNYTKLRNKKEQTTPK